MYFAVACICMILLGAILMLVGLVSALVSRRWGRAPGARQGKRANQRVAGACWIDWLCLGGFLLFVGGIGLVLVILAIEYWKVETLRASYSRWLLLVWGILLVVVGLGARWGVAAAARFSVWVFVLAAAVSLFVLFIPARPPPRQAPCVSNLKQLALAFLMYADDYDGKLPPAGSWPQVILPYTRNEQIFVCPATRKRYIFNEALAGKDIEEIYGRAAEVPLAWDALTDDGKPPHDGGLNVAFLDGHAQWVKLDEFRELFSDRRDSNGP